MKKNKNIIFYLFSLLKNYRKFLKFRKKFQENRNFEINWKDRYLCLDDSTKETKFDAHYVYHPAWAARILAQTKPEKHIDVSSTLHFCSLISAFVPIVFYDFRPVQLNLDNLISKKANLTSLPFENNKIKSLSCPF